VINLAARAGVRASVENPWIFVETNMTGTVNLLEACRRSDIPKFILASTSSIYGSNAPNPHPKRSPAASRCSPMLPVKKGLKPCAMPIIS
jgi:UDP-glucuronate 4-epimerase